MIYVRSSFPSVGLQYFLNCINQVVHYREGKTRAFLSSVATLIFAHLFIFYLFISLLLLYFIITIFFLIVSVKLLITEKVRPKLFYPVLSL